MIRATAKREREGSAASGRQQEKQHVKFLFQASAEAHQAFVEKCASKRRLRGDVLRALVDLYSQGKLDREVDAWLSK